MPKADEKVGIGALIIGGLILWALARRPVKAVEPVEPEKPITPPREDTLVKPLPHLADVPQEIVEFLAKVQEPVRTMEDYRRMLEADLIAPVPREFNGKLATEVGIRDPSDIITTPRGKITWAEMKRLREKYPRGVPASAIEQLIAVRGEL